MLYPLLQRYIPRQFCLLVLVINYAVRISAGFSAVQDYMDETTEEAPVSLDAKPSAAASWGTEGKRVLEDDFDQGSATPKEASPSVVGPASADVKLQETGESLTKSKVEGVADDVSTSGSLGDEKSGLTTSASASKRSERYGKCS